MIGINRHSVVLGCGLVLTAMLAFSGGLATATWLASSPGAGEPPTPAASAEGEAAQKTTSPLVVRSRSLTRWLPTLPPGSRRWQCQTGVQRPAVPPFKFRSGALSTRRRQVQLGYSRIWWLGLEAAYPR